MGKFSRFLDVAALGATRANKGVNKAFNVGVGSLVKETPANLSNAYFGLKPSAYGNTVAVAGAAAFAGFGTLSTIHSNQTSGGDIAYQGAPPIFAGDGIQNTSKAPTLGANGSLVFGLNAMRRG